MWPKLRHSKPVLIILHKLRCSQPVYLYAMNWDVQTPFTYTPLWTEAFTTHLPILYELRNSQPAYLHALKWCLNPIQQYSSILRCEKFVDQYILNWNVCNLFIYTLRCLEPVDMQAQYWDMCNLVAYTSWTAMFIICWYVCPKMKCLHTVYLYFLTWDVCKLLKG